MAEDEEIAPERVDVVIVGAGPTGLTAAHLCARLGLSAIVLERREGPQRSPAAHVVNARTFEIWRQAGVDMEPVFDECLSPEEAGEVHWVTELGGEVVGSLPFERQGDEMLAVTPTPIRNLSQHRLEPLLLSAHLDVRYGHTWLSMTEQPDRVGVVVGGPQGEYRIEASHLLAADGAASPVRRSLGIETTGPRTIQSFVMVHLGADFRSLVGDATGVLYFLVDPAAGGPFVNHGADREWVFMHDWDPEAEPMEAFSETRCRDLVTAALADPTADFDVLGISHWHMSAQIADTYRSGRTFLVGDAAHRFPPTGGLGLNTGVADVHNLVWKIAAVEAGWAEASILDTYEAERRPVAQFNCDQSLHNALKLSEVPMAFGFTRDLGASGQLVADVLSDPERRAGVEDAIAAAGDPLRPARAATRSRLRRAARRRRRYRGRCTRRTGARLPALDASWRSPPARMARRRHLHARSGRPSAPHRVGSRRRRTPGAARVDNGASGRCRSVGRHVRARGRHVPHGASRSAHRRALSDRRRGRLPRATVPDPGGGRRDESSTTSRRVARRDGPTCCS